MRIQPMLLCLLFISSTSAGCLSNTPDGQNISLNVQYEQANGTIVESYVDGDLFSSSIETIRFDFSNTVSDQSLVKFGIDWPSEEIEISVNPDDDSMIDVVFSEHGIHDLVAYAVDENGNRAHIPIVIRMDLQMEWTETGTYEPSSLIIDPIPANGGISATSILIDSIVENPNLIENIGGGRDVEITWKLVDEQEDACQNRNEVVGEGETSRWQTIHFNSFEIHELQVDYIEGQDLIDVYHTVIIQYPQMESMRS
ncbi:MAG: hypothetical protein VX433_03740 [Candidatus Thermoplasmatota archaeon]|nr:hypothetical protein [Candidatus Thermoplasmatota archaeon]